MPTQDEYNVSKNRQRRLHAKIELLNFKMQTVGEISGSVGEDLNFSNNSTSDIRRTSHLTIYPKDSSFRIEKGGKIFMDKYVKVFLGIEDRKGEVVYTKMGIYILNNPNQVYSETENSISLQLVDLMAKLTGLRGGNLENIEYQIPINSEIRPTIISALAEQGITKYSIGELGINNFPNPLKISAGGTTYGLLSQIKNVLLSDFQMYFDVDGIFRFEKIPSGTNEQVMVTDDLWNYTLIDYNINSDYDNVKNYIEVYGKTHDVSYYNDATWVTQYSQLNVSIPTISTVTNGMKIGFTTPNGTYSAKNVSLKINNVESTNKVLRYYNGDEVILLPNTYYVITIATDSSFHNFLGEVQPKAISKETNNNSPFSIDNIGLLRLVLSGGEYDNIPSTILAQQRADYERYLNCRIQDTITLNCVPILWLDVNWLIEITLPDKYGKVVKDKYIIKAINTTFGLNGTQSIQAMRYYPIA